jgi:hypothetical protein
MKCSDIFGILPIQKPLAPGGIFRSMVFVGAQLRGSSFLGRNDYGDDNFRILLIV